MAKAAAEILRVLRPGGRLHLVDIGGDMTAHDGLPARFMMHSVRSLAKYARVSDEELRRHQADSDPAARRRAGSLIRGDDADHAWATDWACLLWGG